MSKFKLLLLAGLFFLFLKPVPALAQSAPINCPSLPGWQADIALRTNAWHHRGTMVNRSTQLAVGFLTPGGDWVAADLITFGDSGFVSAGGDIFPFHTWSQAGSYIVSIIKGACRFDRKIWVATSADNVSQVFLTQDSRSYTYPTLPSGHIICGTSADYQQWVGALPVGTMSYSMPPLGDYNNYRGLIGGDAAPEMPTSLASGQTNTNNGFSVCYQMSDYASAVQTNTAKWQIVPSPEGVVGLWTIRNLKIYFDCFPDNGPIPTPSPSPTPTPTPLPPGTSYFYGYVKCNSAFGDGIPNANVRIDTQAVQGGDYNTGADNLTTDGDGRFETTFNNTFYGVRLYETNSPSYPVDDGAIIIPANCPNPSSANVNTLSCSNIGTIVGPVTFLDICPLPTPTQAPCEIGLCQLSGTNEKSLNNQWNQGWPFAYSVFTAPYTGDVDLVSVKAGVYGGGSRAITCKVTDEAGTEDISKTLSSALFSGSADLRDIFFSFADENNFKLTGGTKYRLYCKGPDPAPMIFWNYQWIDGGENTVNAKTYCLNICCDPSPPDAATLVSPAHNATVRTESVDLTWEKINNWGTACPAGDFNPTYAVYLTSSQDCLTDLSQCGSLICSPAKANPPPATLSCSSGALTNDTWYYWQVFSRNGSLNNHSVIRSFHALSQALPWWQSQDGDIHADDSITSIIPGSATNPYLSLVGDGGSPGVVSLNGILDIGSEEGVVLSETLWQAKTAYLNPAEMKFEYLKNRLNVVTDPPFSCSPPCDLPAVSGTYFYQGDASFNAKDFGSTEKVVVFVDGNVTVAGDITVDAGGFFALISKNDLKFDPAVTKAQGFFSTDATLSVESEASPPDVAFEGQGSFIGWSAITLKRDLGATNNTLPGVSFISRPDFYINAPADFTLVSSVFQQIP